MVGLTEWLLVSAAVNNCLIALGVIWFGLMVELILFLFLLRFLYIRYFRYLLRSWLLGWFLRVICKFYVFYGMR